MWSSRSAIDAAISHKPDHARVDVVEHLRQLDPDSDQIGDLKEATVSEHLPRRPPVGEPPYLPLVQSMQRRPVRPISSRACAISAAIVGSRAAAASADLRIGVVSSVAC